MRFQQGRVAEDLRRQPIRDDGAIIHDDRAGQEFLHHAQVVRGDEHRLGQFAQQVDQPAAARGSSPAVGSSSTRMAGSIASTVAIAMRFFSPVLR